MNYEQVKMIRTTTDEQLVEIALRLFAYDSALFMSLHKGNVLQVRTAWNGETYTISAEQLNEIKNATTGQYGGSKKVSMIKAARVMFNIGLKEAKELIEQMAREGHIYYETAAADYPTYQDHWQTGVDDRLS